MRVIFDWALDGTAWPGPLGHADFVFGEVWVGPLGLVDLLETHLGLGGQFASQTHRAIALAEHLQERSGYWRASFDVDQLGTCRRLLADRDQLRLWGWSGQPVSQRLRELQEATAAASPGMPDRLEAITAALGTRCPDLKLVTSYTDLSNLPMCWRQVFTALAQAGVSIDERVLDPAPALGDLEAARKPSFVPTGDGRLCLLRRHGPLDLADEVAASLASCDNLDSVVIVGADAVLDRALARHGLPRLGAQEGPPASSGLLRLAIAAAFHPMKMSDLQSLLVADPGPIPKPIAHRLIWAARQFPGRRTTSWDEAIAAGLEHVEEAKRESVAQRVAALLMPACELNERVPVDQLTSRLEVLATWARSRMQHAPSLVVLHQRVRALLDTVQLMHVTDLSLHELRRLCDDLGESSWNSQHAQAGLSHVSRAGAILAPARAIVWWNFSRDTATRPHRQLLTSGECAGLRDAGIEPPDISLAMAIDANAWQRPFTQAQEALVLACPNTESDGQPNHPHPLWDDVVSSLADGQDARKLLRSEVRHLSTAKRQTTALRPLPTPCSSVQVGSPIALRETESPSSIEKLLGCSFAWSLHYVADLQSRLTDALPSVSPLIFGNLSHRLHEQILNQELASPDDAAALAEKLFDEQASNLCEELALPQHQADRAIVRRAVVESARDLHRLATEHGAQGVETEVQGQVLTDGQRVTGRLDVVWQAPPTVIDLKWGKTAPASRLESGTAIQLAAYAAMQREEGRSPESAYYVLNSQRVLAEPDGRFAAAALLQGSQSITDTWSATTATLKLRRAALAKGTIAAPGATVDDVRPSFSLEELTVPPPCRYCGFAGLCGRGGAQ